MAGTSNGGGQRGNLTGGSGRKGRSPTSTSHKGSRVEPSHLTDQARAQTEKKSARAAAKKPGTKGD